MRLDRIVQAADEVIALVRGIATLGGTRGDTSGLVMYSAYASGFRRFVAIRDLANDGSADEAGVLTRSLVNILVRAAWIDTPTDKNRRRDRFRRLLRRQYEDDLYELELQQAAGFVVDTDSIRRTRENLNELLADGVKAMPPDRQLFEAVNLDPIYARVYVPASNAMHFSMNAAIGHMLDVEEVALERRSLADAADVLILAIIVFGTLLELSERTVKHGLNERAADIGKRMLHDLDNASPRPGV